MLNQSLTAKRIFLNAGLVFVALLLFAAGAFARPQDPAERQKAIAAASHARSCTVKRRAVGSSTA